MRLLRAFGVIAASAMIGAGSAGAALFYDDFSTDTSTSYTGGDTHNSGGSFSIANGVLTITTGSSNTYGVAHNTARLRVGEYVAVDVVDYQRDDINLFVSTINRQPADGNLGSHGLRFNFTDSNWRFRQVVDGSANQFNLGQPPAALRNDRDPFSMYIVRDTDTNYRLAFDLGAGAGPQFLTLGGSPTFTVSGTAGREGLYVGVENYSGNWDMADRSVAFDNLRIGPWSTWRINGASGNNIEAADVTIRPEGLTIDQTFGVEYLIVGGGGSGGIHTTDLGNGGGGAGGLLQGVATVTDQPYTVTVGAGGAARTSTSYGENGQDSAFQDLVAIGGGGGAGTGWANVGSTGGSGGGGRGDGVGGAGVPGQGYDGGGSVSGSGRGGGGGGGAGGAGGDGTGSAGGAGGPGIESSITGDPVYYAGGGGGGGGTSSPGQGGAGGGGNGARTTGTAGSGQPGTGGGGGGAANHSGGRSGAGGSGIVIIRHEGAEAVGLSTSVAEGSPGNVSHSSIDVGGQLYQVYSFAIGDSPTSGTFSFDMSGVDLNQRLGTTMTGVLSGTGNLTYNGPGRLTLAAANTYEGATIINGGTLHVNGSLENTSGITVHSGAVLGGYGTIHAAVGGAGTVAPGNSVGILTAAQTDPAGGLAYDFEFTTAGNPAWSDAANSLNDVLRLTHETEPFTGPLGADNVVSVYFGAESFAIGDTFRGAFFTDKQDDFLSFIQDATFNYYVADDDGDVAYGGFDYLSLADYNDRYGLSLSVGVSTPGVAIADFAAGTVYNGYITQFTVVPEPGAWLLLLAALASGLLVRRRP